MAAKHGGARPNAGRKKGVVSQAKRDLKEMAKEHAELALGVLVSVATKSDSDAARVSAANALLDRGYGKPVQAIAGADGEGPVEHVHRITREIVRARVEDPDS